MRGTREDAERAELGLLATMQKTVPPLPRRWRTVARQARKIESEMSIYFVQAGENGPIKIGRADDVYARLDNLQTGNAEELRLLVHVDGDRALEGTLHTHFDKDRIRGEWFRPSPELLQFIAKLNESTTGTES